MPEKVDGPAGPRSRACRLQAVENPGNLTGHSAGAVVDEKPRAVACDLAVGDDDHAMFDGRNDKHAPGTLHPRRRCISWNGEAVRQAGLLQIRELEQERL